MIMEIVFVCILIGLFPLIAFGGWCFQKGEQKERERQEEARQKHIKDLEDAGYDPTPYHYPYKKDK